VNIKIGLCLILCSILISGCVDKNPIQVEKPDIEWGIGVYPHHGFTNANLTDWDDAFKKASRVGKIAHLEVTYGEMTLEDAEFLYDIKVPLARKYGMEIFMQINIFDTIPEMTEYKNYVLKLVEKYKPEYLLASNEINYLYGKDRYDYFVSELLDLYDRIKEVSPKTKSFPSFAYEPMRANHQEFLFDAFEDRVPYFAITSYPLKAFEIYPGYLYESPGDIPINYWDVSDITDKDIFITETGWSTGPYFKGSREDQINYVERVYELVGNNPKIKKVVWITLMDVVDENTKIDSEYPGTMGFFTIEGKEKPAWRLISD